MESMIFNVISTFLNLITFKIKRRDLMGREPIPSVGGDPSAGSPTDTLL